ncbi:hypothetical protein LI177_05835 [bacterium 210820-DFI.6.37]|nr:hypothetical protein [bacterium 210820-DFI.6.37]
MSGQTMNYSKYYKSLKTMPDPIMATQLPKVKMNVNEIVKYARMKGKKVSELTEAEQNKLIKRHY